MKKLTRIGRTIFSNALKNINWRYKMLRHGVFVASVVEDGVVYLTIAKTGFFKPLHNQKHFVIDTKK